MQSTGWTFRAQSAVASGTVSLSINMPSGTVENDIMLMWLTHKGAGYATVPAGWNLVEQNISGSTRGELYWKRAAAAEAGPYSVTGLADTALGMIASYIGGLLSGTVVDVSNSIANAVGVYDTPQVTSTVADALLVSSVHSGVNTSIGSQGTGESNGQGNFFTNFGEWDEQLLRMRTLSDTGTATGTDCRQAVADAIKAIPDITGTLGTSSAFNAESVRIVAALIPETSQLSAGTRYYFGDGPLVTRINEQPAGDWDSEAYGPNVLANSVYTSQLVQQKTRGFHLRVGSFVTNRQGNYDELLGRFVTPPLEAQAISGTIDISLQVLVRWLSSSGLTNDTDAVYKLHVYITVGQTGQVRHTLLTNYIDATSLPSAGSATWTGLTGAQALTAGNALAGDTIVVELGMRIVSSPTPAPTYPPTEYSRITINSWGSTLAGNNTSNCVAAQDSVQGTTTTSRAGWIDFSDTITEQAASAPPANDDFAGATVIPSALPFQSSPLDVSGALSNARTVWFEWTAAAGGNVGIFLHGSNYYGQIVVLTGSPGAFTAETDYQTSGVVLQRGTTQASFDASLGVTYYIAVYLSSFTNSAAGELWITMTFRDLVPAQGDLYIPNLEIYAYRSGLPINWGALSFIPSGCVIDYSGLPLTDLETGLPNTNERIVLNSFGGSILTEILDLDTFDRNEAEVDFIFGAWNSFGEDPQNCAALAMDRDNALVITCQWGSGFLDVNDAGTTGSVAAFFDAVSEFATESAVYRTSIQNGDNTGSPVVAATQFSGLAVDSTTPWYGAVADADGSILYYVSVGFYIPPRVTPGSFTIKAYNLSTLSQLPDIATVTCSGPNAAAGPHGLCLHSDDTLFVCTGSTVQHIDIASGSVLHTYTATGDFGYDGQDLWDVHIHPDGQTIIAIDGQTMTVFEWDIESEVQTDYFQTWLSQGNFTQFAIYQPSALPPPGCPGERSGSFTDGVPYTPVTPDECVGTGTRSGVITGS